MKNPATEHFHQCIIHFSHSCFPSKVCHRFLVALSSLNLLQVSAYFIVNKYCQLAMIDRACSPIYYTK